MESEINKKLKRVSNVQKNFIYQCEVCFEDYDTVKHVPMIVCSNYHALCAQCVKSNLFKKEYNDNKNPTGRYMCSKCSEIIQKDDIREHTILKQVCTYIKTIRQKDQQLRKEFYNHIGTMGMNLVAMRQDFDTIEKNNLILKKENQFLIKQNCRLTDQFNEIQRVKGSFEELQKVAKQVQDMKEIFIFQNAKLQSLKDQVKRKDHQILAKKNQLLTENQKFFSLQGQITQLRQDIKIASKKSKQLIEQNEGAINLKQYLEQEINNLQNQKKRILQENLYKKRKINESLKLMQRYWEDTLKNQQKSNDLFFKFENEKIQTKKQQTGVTLVQKKVQQKIDQLVQSSKIPKSSENHKIQLKEEKNKISLFDESEKQIKNFFIDDQTVTVINRNLSQFAHISFDEGFNMLENRSFTIKIKRLQSQQIFVGLMIEELKHKKKIYDKKGFYAIDGYGKVWIDGDTFDCKFLIKEGGEIKVQFNKETKSIVFSRGGKKEAQIIKLPQNLKSKALYPVVLLVNEGDSFQVLEVN